MRRKLTVLCMAATLVVCSGCAETKAVSAEAASPAEKTASPAVSAPASEAALEEEKTPAKEEAAEAGTEEAGGACGELITVGIISEKPEASDYRAAVDREMKETFTEENGYAASFVYNEENGGQIREAQRLIGEGVDYLLVSAAAADGWDAVLAGARDKGVHVILFDRVVDADESLYEASVVSDMEKEGAAAVAWLERQGLDSCDIIYLRDVKGKTSQEGRGSALKEKVRQDESWKFVAQKNAGGDAKEARRIVEDVIASGESFNVIYAENDDMAKGAVAALDRAGISHGVNQDVIVMSFDGSKWALEELLAQNWNYDGGRSFLQAAYIDAVIGAIESGAVPGEKRIVMEEEGFDAGTITAEDIERYGN